MSKSKTFAVNDRVSSPTFGPGTISRVDERYTTIDFDTGGTRKFVSSIVELEPSDSPMPAKPAARPSKKSKSA
jgi:hypothetical protein